MSDQDHNEIYDIEAEPKDKLPQLTEKQMNFVLGVQAGKTYSDAYRAAFDCAGSSDRTIWAEASRTASSPNVSAWLGYLKSEQITEAAYTKEQHLKDLAAVVDQCRQAGAWSALVKATELLGKATGVYVDKSEVTHIKKGDTALLDEIEAQLGQEARKAAERRLGLEKMH